MEQPVKHPPVVEAPSGETRILLHACCAPCSSAIIECLLYNGITPVIYYSNSNIFPLEEYLIRKNECTRHARSLGLEIVDDDYDHENSRRIAEHLENRKGDAAALNVSNTGSRGPPDMRAGTDYMCWRLRSLPRGGKIFRRSTRRGNLHAACSPACRGGP